MRVLLLMTRAFAVDADQRPAFVVFNSARASIGRPKRTHLLPPYSPARIRSRASNMRCRTIFGSVIPSAEDSRTASLIARSTSRARSRPAWPGAIDRTATPVPSATLPRGSRSELDFLVSLAMAQAFLSADEFSVGPEAGARGLASDRTAEAATSWASTRSA